MKTIKNNLKTLAIAFTVICMIAYSNNILANNEKDQTSNAELQFIGKVKNLPVFRLQFNNDLHEEFIVTIKDENGDILYSEKLKENTTFRMYKLDSENSEHISGTTFEVTGRNSNKTTVYRINQFIHTEDNLVVTRL